MTERFSCQGHCTESITFTHKIHNINMATDENDMKKLEGKWKLYKNENIDAFFSDVGVNFLIRKMIAVGSPEQTITFNGDTVRVQTDAGFRQKDDTFKLNEEIIKAVDSGEEMKMKMTFEDGKLILVQKPLTEGKLTTVIRERDGEELCLQMIRGDIVAKRWFKRMKDTQAEV